MRKGVEIIIQKTDVFDKSLSVSEDDKSLEEIPNGVIIYEWDLEVINIYRRVWKRSSKINPSEKLLKMDFILFG